MIRPRDASGQDRKHHIEVPHRCLKSLWAEECHQIPAVSAQQLSSQSIITTEEQPVLWADQTCCTSISSQLTCTLDKYCGEISLTQIEMEIRMTLEYARLISAPQIWHVSSDK